MLLFFLALMPNGLELSQLEKMWGSTISVEQQLKTIEIYEFLDLGFGKSYIVTPFVANYLQKTIPDSTRNQYMNKICAFYCDVLKNLYSIIELADKEPPNNDNVQQESSF
jgi:hypothetical protein